MVVVLIYTDQVGKSGMSASIIIMAVGFQIDPINLLFRCY